ncbi:OLC1v1007123C1 [Oldenlandia corymbosa var. corymbosa]|uniref:OLC1v1007123C1 n=1 Tax=Oldenlandia corymbosa var. corymbosa TaxID=529605 RepID=A0AAV1DK39_OLDCO|nr:OLC1v1007123C1 [Oldenlandia corymbosa var. corymbosa]
MDYVPTGKNTMIMLPEDLVWEVLKWIPVKSLMRFMCVSRIWLSIILNPRFCEAYRGYDSPSLSSFHVPRYYDIRSDYTLLRLLNIESGRVTSFTLDHGGSEYTNVVDGLMCFYLHEKSWLYNIATREMVQLPDLTTPDPDIVYPTIAIHVTWASIPILNEPALRYGGFLSLIKRGACLGGSLCWKRWKWSQVTAFSLAEEKFIDINPLDSNFFLINFGPSIVVTRCVGRSDSPADELLCYDIEKEIWRDELLELPREKSMDDVEDDNEMAPVVGILPNGKMVLHDSFQGLPFHQLYLFDKFNKKWKQISTGPASEQIF